MQRRQFLTLAVAAAPLAGCSTIRALGQIDQIGNVRRELVAYLPETYLAEIQKDLEFLDQTYTEVLKVINRDDDISLIDVTLIALGSPVAFNMVGLAYENIEAEVISHNEISGQTIPPALVSFNESVKPAYRELRTAINSNDRTRKAIELAALLKPLAIVLL